MESIYKENQFQLLQVRIQVFAPTEWTDSKTEGFIDCLAVPELMTEIKQIMKKYLDTEQFPELRIHIEGES